MNNIDWSTAPEWANYAAMDDNGEWWWYNVRPHQQTFTWQSPDGLCQSMKFADWRDSLQCRPKE